MYRFGMSCFSSLRVRLVAGSIVVLLGLVGWANLHTGHVLHSFSLENTRAAITRTAAALNLALGSLAHSNSDDPDLIEAQLDGLVRGGINGVVYLALADERGAIFIKSRGTPPELPDSDADLERQMDAGTVHVKHPVDWREAGVRYIYFGIDTHLSREVVADLQQKNFLLLGGGLAVAIVALSLITLSFDRKLDQLVRASRALAAGDYRVKMPKMGGGEFEQLAKSFTAMADAVTKRNAALAESNAKLNAMLSTPGLFIGLLDRDGRLVMVNDSALALNGNALDEVLGSHLWDFPAFVHDMAVRESVRDSVHRGRLGETTRVELTCSTRSGVRDGEFTLQPIRDGDGEVVWLISLGVDVTERKRAEAALKASNDEWGDTFDAVADPITVLDDRMRIVKANRAFSVLSGQPVTGLLGTRCAICEKDGKPPRALCPHEVQLKKGPKRVIESTERVSRRYFRVTTSPLTNDEGELRGAVCVSHDLEQEDGATKESLALLERQKDTLIREVHHRVKNHLQGVIGLLRQTQSDHPEVSRVIGEAVNRVVSIATVYGLQSQSANASLDLAELLKAIAGNTMELLPQSPLTLGLGECDRQWQVVPDKAVAVALVINELMLNAVKHMPSGEGGVTVRCDSTEDCAKITIINPGELPQGWDYYAGDGLGTGLDLVRHMLPRRGATLSITEDANQVAAVLTLRAPLISAVR